MLVSVNIQNILLWLNAGTETPTLMVNYVLNNAHFHSNPCINQMLQQILHILHFSTLDSLLNYGQDFVVS